MTRPSMHRILWQFFFFVVVVVVVFFCCCCSYFHTSPYCHMMNTRRLTNRAMGERERAKRKKSEKKWMGCEMVWHWSWKSSFNKLFSLFVNYAFSLLPLESSSFQHSFEYIGEFKWPFFFSVSQSLSHLLIPIIHSHVLCLTKSTNKISSNSNITIASSWSLHIKTDDIHI